MYPHKQQQVTGKMISYLSTEMMLQSLWRRGQQQWRDGYCSHGLLTAATQFFVNTACVSCASVHCPRRQFKSSPAGAHQKKNTYNSTRHIRETADSKHQNLQAQHQHNTHTHTHNFSTPTNMRTGFRPMTMMLPQQNGQGKPPGGSRDNPQNRNGGTIPPQVVLETVVSSSQSQTSSIGIGEYGINPARRGNAAAFSMAVKDSLFPKLKFLQGTNASWTSV